MSKIIVSNLPSNFIVEDIRTIFSKYGNICNITKTDKNTFITYKTREECTKAINAMNNKIYKDCKPLIVDYAYDRDSKIFIFNLPLDTDIVDISSFLSYYGPLEHVKFIKNVLMVVLENKKDAQRLLSLNNKIKYRDKLLTIKNILKNETMFNYSVFVYNIPEEITEMDFLNLFSKYGNVLSSGIKEKRGYINFEQEISAFKSVKYMNGIKLKNQKIRVVLKNVNKN